MNTEKRYKTQGTLASVCMASGGNVSFTIEPVEPFEFPVKGCGETKKFILFQPVSKESSDTEENRTKELAEQIWKMPPKMKFIIPRKDEKTILTFDALNNIKQNRSKVEIEVDAKTLENTSETPVCSDPKPPPSEGECNGKGAAKDDATVKEPTTPDNSDGYTVIKFSVK